MVLRASILLRDTSKFLPVVPMINITLVFPVDAQPITAKQMGAGLAYRLMSSTSLELSYSYSNALDVGGYDISEFS